MVLLFHSQAKNRKTWKQTAIVWIWLDTIGSRNNRHKATITNTNVESFCYLLAFVNNRIVCSVCYHLIDIDGFALVQWSTNKEKMQIIIYRVYKQKGRIAA